MLSGPSFHQARGSWCNLTWNRFCTLTAPISPPPCSTHTSSGPHLLSCPGSISNGARTFRSPILVSLRNRLIQYNIVHRAYLTPARVQRMRSSLSPKCWRCDHAPGDYIHIFWSCPVISVFWSQILTEVNELLSISIVPSPRKTWCPGWLREICWVSFYARKSIVLCWKQKTPPSIGLWKTLVSNVIPLYKDTYIHRGCPKKYDRVWSKWLAEPSTAAAD